MNLQSISVRTKLTMGFGLLALLLVGLTSLSLLRMAEENERFVNYVTFDEARVRLGRQVLEATQRRAVAARNMLIIKDNGQLQAEKTDVEVAHRDVRQHMAELKKLAMADSDRGNPTVLALFNDIERIESRYGPVALNIVDRIINGQKQAAEDQMNAECRPLLQQLTRAAEKYIEYGVSRRAADRDEALLEYQRARQQLMIVAAVSLLAAVAMVIFITRSIIRSLGADPVVLGATADRIAAGDLTQSAEQAALVSKLPEGSVMASMERMRSSLTRIVAEVRSGSVGIATASAEIAQGNLDLSGRTERQAASLQETAASMSQLGSAVQTNAANARQATDLAGGASTVARQGGSVVSEVVQTMKEIDQSSHKIANIIAVIDGIAFQTNILALNAAVEAARAGEQGRGFAVVAGEVRNLAQRSAAAAKEIKDLIQDSVDRVERGAQLADQAGTTMTDVVSSIQRVADLMGEISAASAEQSTGVVQVGQTVNLMDQTTQQNAALVEQGSAAAESLREQAQRLVQLVSAFRIDAGLELASSATPPAGQNKHRELERAKAASAWVQRLLVTKPATAGALGTGAAAGVGMAAAAATADESEWQTM